MAPKDKPSPKWPRRQAPTGVRLPKELVFQIQRRAADESIREGRKVTMREVFERALLEYLGRK